ncbi:MAG: hypothetical protein ACYC6L_08590 [Anaerolineae bacterium]
MRGFYGQVGRDAPADRTVLFHREPLEPGFRHMRARPIWQCFQRGRCGLAGSGLARLMPQHPLLDYAVRWIEKNRR